MHRLKTFALIACMIAPGEALAGLPHIAAGKWISEASSVLDAVNEYLAPRLSVTGDSLQSSDQTADDLNVSGAGIIWSQHTLDLHLRDSASRKSGHGQKSLSLNYAMPLVGNHVQLALEDRQYRGVLQATDRQLDTSGNYNGFRFSASRSLGSVGGIELRQIIRHSGSETSEYEDSEWKSDSSRQQSSLGFQCSGEGTLRGGFSASAQVAALGGLEYERVESSDSQISNRTRYQKVAFSASVRRQWQRWELAVRGRYQVAPDDLPDSERIQVGGSRLVSGFNGQTAYGSEGGWVRLNAASPVYEVPFTDRFRSTLSLSVMRGWSPVDVQQQRRFAGVSAGEISLNLRSRGFIANVTMGRLIDSDRPDLTIPDHPDVSVSLSLGI